MKNLFHKILNALNINGRDWVVLILALLLAFSIWTIHNLSFNYNDYLKVHVVAECDLKGHTNVSSNRSEVIARCRATGYRVIRTMLKNGRSVNVTFRHSDMMHLEGDTFYVTASNLHGYADVIYGPDVNVEYFLTDTIFFRFPFENYKKVPVVPIYSFNFRNQYMAEGELVVDPDSVLVYGDPMRLENISEVHTKPVRYYDLAEDVQGVVPIENLKGVRLSENEVHYQMGVKRFVEVSAILPVMPVNVPSDKVMKVFPSVVEVSLRCNFPLVDDPSRGLRIEADYNEYQKSLGGNCVLRPLGLPRGVISCEIDPVTVSAVIEYK